MFFSIVERNAVYDRFRQSIAEKPLCRSTMLGDILHPILHLFLLGQLTNHF